MFTICHVIDIEAPFEDIYKMIMIPKKLNKWWTVTSSGIPKINEIYNFYFNDECNWYAKVIEVKQNKSIHFLMYKADKDWTGTELVFEIISQSNIVQTLRFEHRNWINTNDHFRRTSYCWALYLQKMKSLLEMN